MVDHRRLLGHRRHLAPHVRGRPARALLAAMGAGDARRAPAPAADVVPGGRARRPRWPTRATWCWRTARRCPTCTPCRPTCRSATTTSSRVDGGPATRLVVTPRRCPLPERAWGWAVQLYALRRRRSWGIGDLADLRHLAAGRAGLGAGVVMINPLHAAAPGRPSSRAPTRRRRRLCRNLAYLRHRGGARRRRSRRPRPPSTPPAGP